MRLKSALIVILGIMLWACGSDSNDDPALYYGGTWDVRYNILTDDCGLVASNIPGFVDQHIINTTEQGYMITAQSSLITQAAGTVREDGSLVFSDVDRQDIFDAGFLCQVSRQVVYENLQGDRAEVLFALNIDCGAVFSCESRAVGEAERQPGGEVDVDVVDPDNAGESA